MEQINTEYTNLDLEKGAETTTTEEKNPLQEEPPEEEALEATTFQRYFEYNYRVKICRNAESTLEKNTLESSTTTTY